MNHPKLLIELKRNLDPNHPMRAALHDWHWRFRMGQADPSEAIELLRQLQGHTWTERDEIETLRAKLLDAGIQP